MPCPHLGHEHDCDPEPECPTCHEIVHDPEHHTCIVLSKEPRP